MRLLIPLVVLMVFLGPPRPAHAAPEANHLKQKNPWFKQTRRTHYAEILNTAFVLLRTKPPKEALIAICGEKGLCHRSGLCAHKQTMAFFWWLCKGVVPGFANLPCVKDNAESFDVPPESDLIPVPNSKQKLAPLPYLEQTLYKEEAPQYMNYLMAKIITGTPEDSVPESPALYTASCNAYRKLCKGTRPPSLGKVEE